ncbi:hypothetical protein AKO1_010121, partial [Acrasis kona]
MLSSVQSASSTDFVSKYEFNSDIDQQLIIKISLKQPLQLCSLLLRTSDLKKGPKIVRIYVNNRNLDFTNVDEAVCAQEVDFNEVCGEYNQSEIPLRLSKFNNVYHVCIYVVNNNSTPDSKTVLTACALFGVPSTTAYNAAPKKVNNKKGWNEHYRRHHQVQSRGRGGYENRPKPNPEQLRAVQRAMTQQEASTSSSDYSSRYNVLPHSLIVNENGLNRVDVAKYKQEYYKIKMGIESKQQVDQLVDQFMKGIEWVMLYYYRGVPSWEWFYPYHYSPFASDIINYARKKIDFRIGQPLSPIEQLIAVLPPHFKPTKSILPKSTIGIVNKILNQQTPLSLFYPHPNVVEIDPGDEGLRKTKRDSHHRSKMHYHYARMVMLLPFVDVQQIKDEMKNVVLSEDEKKRDVVDTVKYYRYNKDLDQGTYRSTVSVLPDVENCHTELYFQ